MIGLWETTEGNAVKSGIPGGVICTTTTGGHALCEEGSDWLGSSTGPHTKESVDGKDRPVVQQGFDLFWMYAPLQSVKRCDMLPLASGKELRTLPESCSQGITRSWLMGLVFLIKSNLFKKIYKYALPDDILV